MQTPPRVPPRFVPTLTEVVDDPAVVHSSGTPAGRSGAPVAPGLTARTRLPAVPPLAPVQRSSASHVTVRAEPVAPPVAVPPPVEVAPERPTLSKDFEELLVHRVMQRVDLSLDKRLRGAIAAVVEAQTALIVPRLREEIEAVVRHAVYEAVADELASGADAQHE